MATLSRIAPEIPVTNLQESIEFYQHRLGFQVAAVMPDHEYAIVERDAIAIHLFADGGGSHARVAMHIFTQELDQLHEEFQRRGAQVTQGITRRPWGNRDFRLKDDSGNELKFTEPE